MKSARVLPIPPGVLSMSSGGERDDLEHAVDDDAVRLVVVADDQHPGLAARLRRSRGCSRGPGRSTGITEPRMLPMPITKLRGARDRGGRERRRDLDDLLDRQAVDLAADHEGHVAQQVAAHLALVAVLVVGFGRDLVAGDRQQRLPQIVVVSRHARPASVLFAAADRAPTSTLMPSRAGLAIPATAASTPPTASPTKVPTSSNRTVRLSPSSVAPAMPGTWRSALPSGLMTTSCWPSSSSTTSPTRCWARPTTTT